MTSISNTPAVFLDSPRRIATRYTPEDAPGAVVALDGRMAISEDSNAGIELVVDLLAAPASARTMVRFFGTPEAVAAFGSALIELAAIIGRAPLDADALRRASVVTPIPVEGTLGTNVVEAFGGD
jgi:hypothetical protein